MTLKYLIEHFSDTDLEINIHYAFSGCKQREREILTKKLLNLKRKVSANDNKYFQCLVNWYRRLKAAGQHTSEWSDNECYEEQKARDFLALVKEEPSAVPLRNIYPKACLLDVGVGDARFAKGVGRVLEMAPIGLDIGGVGEKASLYKHTEEDKKEKMKCWGVEDPRKWDQKALRRIYYDGTHLYDQVRHTMGEDNHFLVMLYIFSLHHFGSVQSQVSNLTEAFKLLEPGGIIVLKEHDVRTLQDSNAVHFQHICFNIINSVNTDTSYSDMYEDTKEAYQKFCKMELGATNYTSKSVLRATCEKIGFHFMKEQILGNSPANAYYIILKKPVGGVIDLVTDLGEECDDEAACVHLYNYCERTAGMFARVFFTKENAQIKFKSLLEGKPPELHNFKTFNFNKATFKSKKSNEKTLLVQIGPIDKSQLDIVEAYATNPFDYILLGELGKTLNSNKADAVHAAEFLLNRSDWGVCVATKGGETVPPFTVAGLQPLGEPTSAIVNHCIKIAFRNTVGRASAVGGQHVAHLVAAHPMGANYQSALSISNYLKMDPNKHSVERNTDIKNVVDSYIEKLKVNGLKVLDFEGRTNNHRNVTISEIEDGYTFIIDTLNQAFGVPIDFFASQTDSREWRKEWEFADDSPHFKATFSGISDVEIHKQMQKAFNTFNAVVKAKPSMPLTPAYDCVALAAAADYFNGTLSTRFDDISVTEISLKSSVRTKGLRELLKWA